MKYKIKYYDNKDMKEFYDSDTPKIYNKKIDGDHIIFVTYKDFVDLENILEKYGKLELIEIINPDKYNYKVKYAENFNAYDLYNAVIPYLEDKIISGNKIYFTTSYNMDDIYNTVVYYGDVKSIELLMLTPFILNMT